MRSLFLVFFMVFIIASCSEEEPEFIDEKPSERIIQDNKQKTEIDSSVKTDKKKNPFYDEKPVAVISPLEAGQYNGKVVTVKGFVADVYKSDKVAYLNFVEKYPKNPFSAVIFASRFSEFGDIENYRLKDVEVTGRISFYRGKPQIILDNSNQIIVK